VHADIVNLHWLWKETVLRLDSFSQRVQLSECVDEAADFARYVMFSGLCRLFEANPSAEPLKVDGPLARWKAEELLRECQERYRTNDVSSHVDKSVLDAINRKLDLIAGQVSRIPTSKAQAPRPELRIITGGAEQPVEVGESSSKKVETVAVA